MLNCKGPHTSSESGMPERFCSFKTRKYSCGKPQEAYRPCRNLSRPNLSRSCPDLGVGGGVPLCPGLGPDMDREGTLGYSHCGLGPDLAGVPHPGRDLAPVEVLWDGWVPPVKVM